jgi:hypothetical protein
MSPLIDIVPAATPLAEVVQPPRPHSSASSA